MDVEGEGEGEGELASDDERIDAVVRRYQLKAAGSRARKRPRSAADEDEDAYAEEDEEDAQELDNVAFAARLNLTACRRTETAWTVRDAHHAASKLYAQI
ncbi:hypothetical protein C8Q80DRAFT_1276040 [Daedaleopsis nitida]|nr:hypothetical protein C8Q80DRAFT_1276040 [Daedaleopsis nitida]